MAEQNVIKPFIPFDESQPIEKVESTTVIEGEEIAPNDLKLEIFPNVTHKQYGVAVEIPKEIEFPGCNYTAYADGSVMEKFFFGEMMDNVIKDVVDKTTRDADQGSSPIGTFIPSIGKLPDATEEEFIRKHLNFPAPVELDVEIHHFKDNITGELDNFAIAKGRNKKDRRFKAKVDKITDRGYYVKVGGRKSLFRVDREALKRHCDRGLFDTEHTLLKFVVDCLSQLEINGYFDLRPLKAEARPYILSSLRYFFTGHRLPTVQETFSRVMFKRSIACNSAYSQRQKKIMRMVYCTLILNVPTAQITGLMRDLCIAQKNTSKAQGPKEWLKTMAQNVREFFTARVEVTHKISLGGEVSNKVAESLKNVPGSEHVTNVFTYCWNTFKAVFGKIYDFVKNNLKVICKVSMALIIITLMSAVFYQMYEAGLSHTFYVLLLTFAVAVVMYLFTDLTLTFIEIYRALRDGSDREPQIMGEMKDDKNIELEDLAQKIKSEEIVEIVADAFGVGEEQKAQGVEASPVALILSAISLVFVGTTPKFQSIDAVGKMLSMIRNSDYISVAVMNGFKDIINMISVATLGRKMLGRDAISDKYDKISKDYGEIQLAQGGQVKFSHNPELAQKMIKIYEDAVHFRNEIARNPFVSASEKALWIRLLLSMYDSYQEALAFKTSAKTRIRPLWIHLVGEPGVGKTYMTSFVIQCLKNSVTDQKWTPADNYERKQDEEFWSNYHGQWAVTVDDAFQAVDKDVRARTSLEFIYMINNNCFPLNMAAIADKGNIFMESRVCVSSGNVIGHIENSGLTAPDALYRRCHIPVYVTMDKKVKNGSFAEVSKNWRFYVLRNLKHGLKAGNYLYSRSLSFDEFMLHCERKYREIEDEDTMLQARLDEEYNYKQSLGLPDTYVQVESTPDYIYSFMQGRVHEDLFSKICPKDAKHGDELVYLVNGQYYFGTVDDNDGARELNVERAEVFDELLPHYNAIEIDENGNNITPAEKADEEGFYDALDGFDSDESSDESSEFELNDKRQEASPDVSDEPVVVNQIANGGEKDDKIYKLADPHYKYVMGRVFTLLRRMKKIQSTVDDEAQRGYFARGHIQMLRYTREIDSLSNMIRACFDKNMFDIMRSGDLFKYFCDSDVNPLWRDYKGVNCPNIFQIRDEYFRMQLQRYLPENIETYLEWKPETDEAWKAKDWTIDFSFPDDTDSDPGDDIFWPQYSQGMFDVFSSWFGPKPRPIPEDIPLPNSKVSYEWTWLYHPKDILELLKANHKIVLKEENVETCIMALNMIYGHTPSYSWKFKPKDPEQNAVLRHGLACLYWLPYEQRMTIVKQFVEEFPDSVLARHYRSTGSYGDWRCPNDYNNLNRVPETEGEDKDNHDWKVRNVTYVNAYQTLLQMEQMYAKRRRIAKILLATTVLVVGAATAFAFVMRHFLRPRLDKFEDLYADIGLVTIEPQYANLVETIEGQRKMKMKDIWKLPDEDIARILAVWYTSDGSYDDPFGGDIIVRDGRVSLKTVRGKRPVDMMMESQSLDPKLVHYTRMAARRAGLQYHPKIIARQPHQEAQTSLPTGLNNKIINNYLELDIKFASGKTIGSLAWSPGSTIVFIPWHVWFQEDEIVSISVGGEHGVNGSHEFRPHEFTVKVFNGDDLVRIVFNERLAAFKKLWQHLPDTYNADLKVDYPVRLHYRSNGTSMTQSMETGIALRALHKDTESYEIKKMDGTKFMFTPLHAYLIEGLAGFKGMCMTVYVKNKQSKDYILGVHVAGGPYASTIVPITKAMIADVVTEFLPSKQTAQCFSKYFDVNSPGPRMDLSNTRPFHPLTKKPHMPFESVITPSPFQSRLRDKFGKYYDCPFPVTKVPANLSKVRLQTKDADIEISSYQESLRGITEVKTPSIPPYVYEDMKHPFLFEDILPKDHRLMREFTKDQAINGDSNIGLGAIPMQTSMGFPFVLEGLKTADCFILQSDGKYHPTPFFNAVYDQLLDTLDRGKIPPNFVLDNLKDETRKLTTTYTDPSGEVHQLVKPIPKISRLFEAGSKAFLVIGRQLFGDMVINIEKNHLHGTIKVGINPHGTEWKYMFNQLLSISDDVSAGDIKQYDKKQCLYFAKVISWWTAKIYGYEIGSKEHLRQYAYLYSLLTSIHISPLGSYCAVQGNSSGNFLTTIFNSIVNQIMHRLVWMHVAPLELKYSLRQYVNENYYGDDSFNAIAKLVQSFYNMQILKRYLKEWFGMDYIDPFKKGSELPLVYKYDEAVFLSRSFRVTHDGLNVFPALDKESIQNSLLWMENKESKQQEVDDFFQTCEMACMEAFYHGEDYYNYIRSVVNTRLGCLRPQPQKGRINKTYKDLWSLWCQGSWNLW